MWTDTSHQLRQRSDELAHFSGQWVEEEIACLSSAHAAEEGWDRYSTLHSDLCAHLWAQNSPWRAAQASSVHQQGKGKEFVGF